MPLPPRDTWTPKDFTLIPDNDTVWLDVNFDLKQGKVRSQYNLKFAAMKRYDHEGTEMTEILAQNGDEFVVPWTLSEIEAMFPNA